MSVQNWFLFSAAAACFWGRDEKQGIIVTPSGERPGAPACANTLRYSTDDTKGATTVIHKLKF